jgi:hypothetical protein
MATAHGTALESRHARLDTRLAAETARPAPDAAVIARLKREKLRVKDELSREM